MKKLTKTLELLYDVIELYLPCIAFIGFFLLFVTIIISRYIFNFPISKLNELSFILYLFCVSLNASYGSRKDTHVVFSVVYDNQSDKGKIIMRFIANIIIIVVFAICLPQVVEAVTFMKVKSSSLLHFPYNIMYFPFVIFMVFSLLHHLTKLIKDIKTLNSARKEGEKA